MSQTPTKKHSSKRLDTPLKLPALSTPDSTSSISFSPSGLTPSSLSSFLFSAPAVDLPHSTLPAPPRTHQGAARMSPRYSRTRAMQGVFGGRSMSRVLQRVMGVRESEVFEMPVLMDGRLEEGVFGVLGGDEGDGGEGDGDEGDGGDGDEDGDGRGIFLGGLGEAFASMTTLALGEEEEEDWRVGSGSGVFVERHQTESLTTDTQEQGDVEQQQQHSVPKIRIEPASPLLPSLKLSSLADTVQADAPQAFSEENCGLPVLAEAGPTGNTTGLLEILLTWSVTSQRLFDTVPDVNFFRSINVFPRRWEPPLHQDLVSAAFYDTSSKSHTENRFIGPGDVARISYNEVDVFSIPGEFDTKTNGTSAKANKLFDKGKKKTANTSAIPENTRWAYIILKDHVDPTKPNDTPAHMIIAWPLSSTTSRSSTINILLPDSPSQSSHHPPIPALPTLPTSSSKQALPRFSSFQNLRAAFSSSSSFRQNLRSVQSSTALRLAELQDGRDVMEKVKLEVEGYGEDQGAKAFRREVMVLGKKGGVPLVEGWGVDTGVWDGWLGAVARGEGQVVGWREME